jgi:hypothetical protein
MRAPALCLLLLAPACTGNTGDHLITFSAAAAGPATLPPAGGPLEFDSPLGYHVRLDRARLHVGAVYLNQTLPLSGGADTTCIQPGVYVAQVIQGLDIDTLSSRQQPFPVDGEGTTLPAQAGEVWLTGGDVTAAVDNTTILDVAGEAFRDPERFPFSGTITISNNRTPRPPNPATLPGAKPICKVRIVTPVLVDLALAPGGTLVLRADPRLLFANVEFAGLARTSDDPLAYQFDDRSMTAPSRSLFQSLQAANTYRFEFLVPPP